ncbi:golgin subfamily A member 3-like [Penaeus japonicus]|uniref:golgin subfamily A member 3-like n=1 Tax=Penaeus japonicus TaxID=27405 RepID=UPI001C70F3EA|nr:golgin subfamily A member 3-like [Penaeus japonicus]
MWLHSLALVVVVLSLGGAVPVDDEEQGHVRVARQQSTYGITHLDIRDAILTLDKSIKAAQNKLTRHEAREAQVADFSTKTLNALSSDHALTEKNMQTIAHQLAKMEERMLSMEALIHTTDERQRLMLTKLSQGLDRLLIENPDDDFALGPPTDFGGNTVREVKKLTRKVNQMDNMVERELRQISNEVKIVGESLSQHMEQLQSRHDRLATGMDSCERETISNIQQLGAILTHTSQRIDEKLSQTPECNSAPDSEITSRLNALDHLYREQEAEIHQLSEETHKSLEENLETLQTLIKESHRGQALINSSVADLNRNLRILDDSTQDGLGRLDSNVQQAVKDGTETLSQSVTKLELEMKQGNSHIMDTLDDSASQAENLQNTVLENYSELSAEINSLRKVEQVMINTADAVLDTKRSIEYGIQQIIFELGDIVKNSGHTINSTLSDQISNVSFAILKNQTSALTNMTAKMEKEISQVWRQIGVMYQQMSQSVDLLDQLSSTTKEHMNASLSRVGTMDGTVGQINTKVADVENNLNYLLGRLSLVVSEFNLMKTGVGEELVRLRENLARENTPVQFAEGEPESDTRYDVNRKRHAIPPTDYFSQPREPISVF